MTENTTDHSNIIKEAIEKIQLHLQNNNTKEIKQLIKTLHAADAADLIQQLSNNERHSVFVTLKGDINPEILTYIDEEIRENLFQSLSNEQITSIIDHLESDDALEIIENLDEERQLTLLKTIPKNDRVLYEESLTWPENSAGRIMRREAVTIPSFWTVGQIIDHLRNKETQTPNNFHNIIVVGRNHKPMGMISLGALTRSVRSTPVGKLMQKDIKPIEVDMEQEDVAHLFRRYGYVEMPVIDAQGRLLGTITIDDIIFVMKEEYEDDLLKMGGISGDDFYSDIKATVRRRFSWLLVNLATAVMASIVIAFFDSAIEKVVALAVLMPIVASMGGNAGTQTLTVAVRALATGELTVRNARRVIYKEVFVGLMNGFIFAVIGGLMTWIWFSDVRIGLVIGLALIINLVFAGLAGAGIPFFLDRLGADPAVSSSIFLTTITDVVGFFAFLGIGVLVLF